MNALRASGSSQGGQEQNTQTISFRGLIGLSRSRFVIMIIGVYVERALLALCRYIPTTACWLCDILMTCFLFQRDLQRDLHYTARNVRQTSFLLDHHYFFNLICICVWYNEVELLLLCGTSIILSFPTKLYVYCCAQSFKHFGFIKRWLAALYIAQ